MSDWCDGLLASHLSEKTVGEKYLAAVKTVFKLAVEKFRLPVSPVAANKVRVPDRVKARPSGFTEDEAKAILRAALVNPAELDNRPDAAKRAIRWVPWICAYTGARVGEISQLRKVDLHRFRSGQVLRLSAKSSRFVNDGKPSIITAATISETVRSTLRVALKRTLRASIIAHISGRSRVVLKVELWTA